jgi:hypothetical protein
LEGLRQPTSELEKRDSVPRAKIPWAGILFLVLIAPFTIVLITFFDMLQLNIVEHKYSGSYESGAIVSLVIAVFLAVILIDYRSAIISGAEIGLYWLSCAAVFLLAWLGYFWLGLGYEGFVIAGAFIIVISAMLMVLWRRSSLSDAEVGLYWLGCTAASIYALGEYVPNKKLLGPGSWWQYDYYIAFIIALGIAAITAIALALWRKDTNRYWLVGTLLGMVITIVAVKIHSDNATNFFAFLPLLVLISALVLAILERTAKNASP